MTKIRLIAAVLWAAAGFLPGTAAHAISSANYTVSTIATPDVATGGVARVGDALFVGVGAFGGATQSIVRIDSSGTTTIADGFNALSGMVYDPINDRLVVGDNGPFGGVLGAGQETGDTLYTIDDPLNLTGAPLRAKDIKLLPDFSIPGIADVALDPSDPTGQSFFATDSSEGFPFPNGLLLSIDLSNPTPLATLESGLGFGAGVAASSSEIFFGELDPSLFTGLITSTPIGASGTTLLVSGLDGQADLVLASDGNLLATSSKFSGPSSILRIDPVTGAILEVVADGFDFATALAEEDGVIYVVEGGAPQSRILVLTLIPEPGTGFLVGIGLGITAFRRVARRRAVRRRAVRRRAGNAPAR